MATLIGCFVFSSRLDLVAITRRTLVGSLDVISELSPDSSFLCAIKYK